MRRSCEQIKTLIVLKKMSQEQIVFSKLHQILGIYRFQKLIAHTLYKFLIEYFTSDVDRLIYKTVTNVVKNRCMHHTVRNIQVYFWCGIFDIRKIGSVLENYTV